MHHDRPESERVVITGIGLTASVGDDRESVWQAVRDGHSAMRRLSGMTGIPDGLLIGAPVDIELDSPDQLKVLALCNRVSDEAMKDANLDRRKIDPGRFGCAVSAHMGDMRGLVELFDCAHLNPPTSIPWREQWLPNTACWQVASRHGLYGPRLVHSTACASGLIAVLMAVRAIQDGQCDVALAGSAEAITPLFAAGFHQMRVLANHDDPRQACRPFNLDRQGFVMGEGGAMFVLERVGHALARGAEIYAEVAGGRLLATAHHVTSLDIESDTLAHLISETLRVADLRPADIGYINVHGTATQQNDLSEARAIRRAMGSAADMLCASATKSILGHLINAAGSVELAITALAMRDGFVPPTLNLTRPDPQCDLDCIPLVGRKIPFVCALKLSVAFGGTLAAIVLKRPDSASTARKAKAA
ncbi:MAG: beta-ketoacyl-[acyl-carrier-protein] synthase family protein [Pirellulales bacterium]